MARFSGAIDMRGFSTLEIIIAMAIMVSTISAVVLVVFGDQTLLEQASTNAGAVERAQSLLEVEQANARKDFRLVTDVVPASDGSYQTSLIVGDVATDPYTTKRITATASWSDESHMTRNVSLSELVTDFNDPMTLDTCDSALAGNWYMPSITNYVLTSGNLLPTNAKMAAVNTIGAIDAYHGKLYIVDASRSSKTNDSFFIFDLANPTQPVYIGSTDSATSTTDGANAVTIAGNYAFLANAHGANFRACKPAGNCSQLQILNIAVPSSPMLVGNFLLPTSSAPFIIGSGGQATGNSLFYDNGYIYIGLTKTSSGPEFNIIDVHDLAHLVWVGGYAIGSTINQIYVHSGYAYLATDDQSHKLIILDVHDPQNPSLVSTLDPHGTSNQEYGYSVYKVGDQIFFGMSSTSISGSPELTAFNVADPTTPVTTASREVGASILSMFVRDTELFLLSSIAGLKAEFQMLNDTDLVGGAPVASPLTLPGSGVSMDCEGNYFYVATNNGSQGNISIIGPHI